ncbi:MAG: extracellular solute-binding protein [Chloroflexota bacterium]
MSVKKLRLFTIFFFIYLTINSTHSTVASEIILTIRISQLQSTIGLFDTFEADHPGVKIVVTEVGADINAMRSPVWNIEGYLDDVRAYVSSADVVEINPLALTLEGTRANYFLDLSPLVTADSALNEADFYPGMLESYQWDGKTWALPQSASLSLLYYDPAFFDAAALTYPTSKWTVDDFERVLLNKSTQVKFQVDDFGVLLASLSGHGLFDTLSIPNQLNVDNVDLVHIMNVLAPLQKQGLLGYPQGSTAAPLALLNSIQVLFADANQSRHYTSSLLPGESVGLWTTGYAVSSGTAYPELAYELAKYVTSAPKVVMSQCVGDTTARRSTLDTSLAQCSTPSVEAQNLINIALANPTMLTPARMQFMNYVVIAYLTMVENGGDAEQVLQIANQTMLNHIDIAEKRASNPVTVMSISATALPQAGETPLKFGLSLNTAPITNLERWQQIAADFAATDPQISRIDFDTSAYSSEKYASTDDCFYSVENAIIDANLNTLVSLDPLLVADPEFHWEDFAPGIVSQIQRQGKVWMLPITLHPQVIWYDPEAFNQARIAVPVPGWDTDTFTNDLYALRTQIADQVPFLSTGVQNTTHLLAMIASFDGLPVDFRMNPPISDLSNPETINAIHQVFDLAKSGYISYDTVFSDPAFAPLYNGFLGFFDSGRLTDEGVPYRMTSYPIGHHYLPVSFSVGGGYISAIAQNREACYRWLTYLTQHPDLFPAMPARTSKLNDAALEAAQGIEAINYYQFFDHAIRDPKAIYFPTQLTGLEGQSGSIFVLTWLDQAFEHYVKKDSNFDTELLQLQSRVNQFNECAASILSNYAEPSDPETENQYRQQFKDCAIAADPTLQ